MPKTIMELVAEAKAAVPAIGVEEAQDLMGRDDREVAASGKVKGAVHASRGFLEFRADPTSPLYDPVFTTAKTVILYCASGGRAALGGQALQGLGYGDVRNLGAFKAWVEAGGAVEEG